MTANAEKKYCDFVEVYEKVSTFLCPKGEIIKGDANNEKYILLKWRVSDPEHGDLEIGVECRDGNGYPFYVMDLKSCKQHNYIAQNAEDMIWILKPF